MIDIEKTLDIVTPYVTQMSNLQIHRDFPLLSESHFNETDVRMVLKNYLQLALIWNEKYGKR